MYPRLQAEEAITGASVATAGNPHTTPDGRKRLMAAWERALPQRAAQRKQLTADEFADYMRALGMEAVDGRGQSRH